MSRSTFYRHVYQGTPAGSICLVWRLLPADTDPLLVRIFLPLPHHTAVSQAKAVFPASRRGLPAACEGRWRTIIDLLDSRAVAPDLSRLVVFDQCGPFQERVLRRLARVPAGQIITYHQLAADLDCPRGARAVGQALARNPFPLVIPCHRAVRGNGSLGGYQGGSAMKRLLLEREGVLIDHRARVIQSGVTP